MTVEKSVCTFRGGVARNERLVVDYHTLSAVARHRMGKEDSAARDMKYDAASVGGCEAREGGRHDVRDRMVVGGEEAGSGIVFRGKFSSSNMVDLCRIAEFPVSGIRFEGDSANPLSSNTVSRCHLIGSLQDQLYRRNNNHFYIPQNQFGTHGRYPRTGAKLIRNQSA